MKFGIVAALLLSSTCYAQKSQKPKPIVGAEKKEYDKAIAKFSGFKDAYRSIAVDYWKELYEEARTSPKEKHEVPTDDPYESLLLTREQHIQSVLSKAGEISPVININKIGAWGRLKKIKVNQIVSDTKALCGDDNRFFIEGIDTKAMVDDKWYLLKDTFIVVGTETYHTALGGSKKVFVLKPLNPKIGTEKDKEKVD